MSGCSESPAMLPAAPIWRTTCRIMAVLLLAAAVMVSLARSAEAQVEMIVRVENGAPIADMLSGAAKTDIVTDSLLANVLSVQSLFSDGMSSGKSSAALFPAFLLELPDSAALSSSISGWAAIQGVRYAQRNHRYRVDQHAAGDPLADSLDHFPIIGVEQAWKVTTGSADVTVGLVDTGVLFDHPDLIGQFAIRSGEDANGDGYFTPDDLNGVDDDGNGYVDDVAGYDFVDRPATVEPGDFLDPDPIPEDDGSGHGTNVAGIVAAAHGNGIGISGVAPGVRILPLRAFGRDGRGDDDDIARAVVYAAENGVGVLNLSFGDTYFSPLMQEAIQYATGQGVVVVASAGNVGGDAPHYPSDYPEVISVAWMTAGGSTAAPRATTGVGVDIGAPGSSVFTTIIPAEPEGDDEYYGRRSGSSMAAPMVSATAALIRSIDPSLSPAAVRSALAATAEDIGTEGWDHDSGAGLLNAGRAVLRVVPGRVEITSPPDNGGLMVGPVRITGSAIDPSFEFFDLWYAADDDDFDASDWTRIGPRRSEQVLNGILGDWDIAGLADGLYTLRLRVVLRSGRTLEERRRVFVDRTAPVVDVRQIDAGFIGGRVGVIADVETDDLSHVELVVGAASAGLSATSDRVARRHGVFQADAPLVRGSIPVTIRATNTAGLESSVQTSVDVPGYQVNTGLVQVFSLEGPDGFLLDHFTDFDGDGLQEVVLNRYEDGWIGDTLAVMEWGGDGLRRAASIVAGVIPRDTGDSDGDGLSELLTQIGAATLLVEQDAGAFPQRVIFSDTTGLSGNSGESFWGARIADLDDDGRHEIIGHNTREWRVLEFDGESYREVARLVNPTDVSNSELVENSFEQPYCLIDDLDADGRQEMLVGDSDGDWIVYEARGDNRIEAVWWYETDRYDGGSRFAAGDLNGDGILEFVVYDHNWLTTTSNGETEPDIGRYTVFSATGDNDFEPVDHFLAAGEATRHGSMAVIDVTGDSTDDLLLVNPPDLYVISYDSAFRGDLVYHAGLGDPTGFAGFRSTRMVTGDIDGDDVRDVVLADASGGLRLLTPSADGAANPAPVWLRAVAADERTVELAWKAAGSDSVRVFRADPGGPFDPVATVTGGTYVDSTFHRSEYILRGWYQGDEGVASRSRTVRPHAPAVVVSVERSSQTTIEVRFSERLDPRSRAEQFVLANHGPASSLTAGKNGFSVILGFPGASAAPDTLRWFEVMDAEGTPVGQTLAAVEPFEETAGSLILASWEVLAPGSVRLIFNHPLDPAAARQTGNFELNPSGSVEAATFDGARPAEVILALRGVAAGATGLNSRLKVVSMRSVDGRSLAPEGATVLLSLPAEDLSGVYVFPNPYQPSSRAGGMMIAGLPPEASIEILSPDGIFVRQLREDDGDGGVLWDLRDETGRPAPSGVYLIIVRSTGLGPVLKKAAVIQ